MSDHHDSGKDQPDESDEGDVSAEPAEHSGIQIDAYGIKVNLTTAETGDAKPKSWAEVGRQVNAKLMNIVLNVVGLPEDIVVGTRRLVRGLTKPPRRRVTKIPKKIAREIELGHDQADRAEAIAQEKVERKKLPPALSEVVGELEAFLREKQADGIAVEIRDLGDGRQAIVIVQPKDRAIVGPLIRKALPAPTEPAAEPPKKPAKRTRRKQSDPMAPLFTPPSTPRSTPFVPPGDLD